MLYAIIGQDVPNSLEKRMSVRPAHLQRLNELQNTVQPFRKALPA